MRRFLSAGLSATVLLGAAAAHDFWIAPSEYVLDEPGDIRLAFEIGHGKEVDAWGLRWDRIAALQRIGEDGISDLQAGVVPTTAMMPGFAKVSFARPGTHLLAFSSYHSVSELGAEAFTDFAEKEGLTKALSHRERQGTQDTPGSEIYSRRAKTLVQVGDVLTDTVLQPIGQTLEIVPERHPYGLNSDRQLPVRVLWRGKPLAGALIDLTDLETGAAPMASERTDGEGRATFEIPEEGTFKLNVIWSVPNPGNDRATFETVFSSLTFAGTAD